jgi:hypothetical protein
VSANQHNSYLTTIGVSLCYAPEHHVDGQRDAHNVPAAS